MALGNYYGNYQPGYYSPPMQDQLTQLRQQQYQPPMQPPQIPAQPASNGIIWVQGEEGAKAYMVAAGNSVLLMDSENSAFYIKSTDASGMPMPLRVFDYTERTITPKSVAIPTQNADVEYVTREEFIVLTARLDALASKEQKSTKATKPKEENENV